VIDEAPRSGTIVVRDAQVVMASEGAARLLGHDLAVLQRLPFEALFAPEERERILDRYRRRLRGEPVPTDYEAVVLLADGARATFELHVDREGRDVVVRFRDVTQELTRRNRLLALATLGAEIQRARTEAEVVERLRTELPRLELYPLLMRASPEGVRVTWSQLPPHLEGEFEELFGRRLAGFRGRWSAFSRKVWEEGAAFTDDWGAEVSSFLPELHASRARAMVAAERLARAAAVRLDERSGPRFYLVLPSPWLRGEDLAAVRLFAAQVAASLDAAGAIAELSRRLSDLTALHALTNRIFANPPGDVAALLRDGCAQAAAALACTAAAVDLVEPDGQTLRPAGQAGPHFDRAAAFAVDLVGRTAVRGVLHLAHRPGRPFTEGEQALARALAGELAVGLEAAELYASAQEQVRHLSLLGDMGRMLASSLDLDEIVAVGAEAARLLLGTDRAFLVLADPARAEGLRLAGGAGDRIEEILAGYRPTLAESGLTARVLREGRTLVVEDLDREPAAHPAHRTFGSRAAIAAPLLARGEPLGVLFADSLRPRSFSEDERERAAAVANHLAVAVENARLFAEARGRLAELTTVMDVARVVSSTLDLDQVLTAGAEHLKATLGAAACTILLEDLARGDLRRAAHRGPPLGPEIVAAGQTSLAWSALEGSAPATGALEPGGPPVLAVPLHVRDRPVGVALVAGGRDGAPFQPAELSRALAIAHQLAVAVDNARLYEETVARAEELGLLYEMGRSLVATLDLGEVLDAGVRNLARIVDAPLAALALVTDDGAGLEFRAVFGPQEVVGQRPPLDLPGSFGALAFSRRTPLVVEDARTDPRISPEQRELLGGSAYLVVPLLVRERYVGTAVIIETAGPRRFGAAEVERATAVANQLAVAVENARLYADLRRSYEQLAQAQQQLIQKERLAALGELSAVVAHEVRNPLGVIFNSLGSLRRMLQPTGDAKMLLDIVGEEADRLNRIVRDLLDFARPVTPVLRPEPLEAVVDEAVAAALAHGGKGVVVDRAADPDLPPVPMDARLVRQAILNLAENAIQAMPRGGWLRVRLARANEAVVLELEDTGPGIPEEVRPRIFEPFFTTKATGTGLGLAVVRRILEGHGGEIAVERGPEGGARFRVRFPVAGRTAGRVETAGRMG